MALPSYVAAGSTFDSTGAGSVLRPTGILVDDILLLVVETANEVVTITNQNGGTWTEIASSPQGTGSAGGTSATRLTVFWSRNNGTQGAPSISDSGNHQIAQMTAWRGCRTTGSPVNITSGAVDTASDTSGSLPGATTTAADCLVVIIGSTVDDAISYSTPTNTDLASITFRSLAAGTAGNDGAFRVFSGEKASAGAYGTTSLTASANTVKGMMSIALEGAASTFTGEGTPSVPQPAVSAVAALVFIGTAALSVPQASVAATGGWSEPVTGTAALSVPASSVAASGQVIFTGTGALTVPTPSVSSTATFIANAGSAALTVPTLAVAGSGLETFAGTSAISVPASAVAASGLETFTGTADLPANATISAAGENSAGPAFGGGAALTVPTPTISASGTQVFDGSGALSVPALAVASSGLETFTASGTVAVPTLVVSGAGLETFSGSAAVSVPAPSVSGAGFGAGVGAVAVPQPSVAASGTLVAFVGTGTITVPTPQVVGIPGGQLPFRAMAVHYAAIALTDAQSDTATLLMRHAASNALTSAPEDAVEQASVMDSFTCDNATVTCDNNHGTCDDAPMRYL